MHGTTRSAEVSEFVGFTNLLATLQHCNAFRYAIRPPYVPNPSLSLASNH